MRKLIVTIHLWLGLSTGLIVFVIAITGCIYAFKVEIENATQPYRFVEAETKPFLAPSVLQAAAEKKLPGKLIHAVQYHDATRAAQVIFFNNDPDYYYFVYVNPYTAEVLKVKDMDLDFFQFILNGHFYLWLPPDIGQPIAAIATLIFVVMLITGIILWWPKRKKDTKQRFSIKWKARWRRVNYDLHNVLGFYASSVALILALTGLVWGFQWFASGLYAVSGGDKVLAYTDPLSDTTKQYRGDIPVIDKVFYEMTQNYPHAKAIEVHIPHSNVDAIAANANSENGTYWKLDYRYYDQHTLKEVSVDHIYGKFSEAKGADKLLRMNYDVHTGAILGLPGKILVFFASLICASLPITGTYIWWGRRNKERKEKAKRVSKTNKSLVKSNHAKGYSRNHKKGVLN